MKSKASVVITKIIWIIGALIFALLTVESFTSIGSAGEDTSDCIRSGIYYGLYLLAFLSGILYLFRREWKKSALICAVIYTAADGFGLIRELITGGRLSAADLTTQILSFAAYAVFTAFVVILITGQPDGTFPLCLKVWYLPPVVLLLVEFTRDLATEFIQSDTFLWDAFLLDSLLSVLIVAPIFTMMMSIKGGCRNKNE